MYYGFYFYYFNKRHDSFLVDWFCYVCIPYRDYICDIISFAVVIDKLSTNHFFNAPVFIRIPLSWCYIFEFRRIYYFDEDCTARAELNMREGTRK
jgi:hypothetical protein